MLTWCAHLQGQGPAGLLLRERTALAGSNAAVSVLSLSQHRQARHSSCCTLALRRCVRMHYATQRVKSRAVNSTVRQRCATQMDDAMGQAQAVASSLADQRQMFDNIGSKLMTIGNKFPIVNGLLNAIRRKKNRVRYLISGSDYRMRLIPLRPGSCVLSCRSP